MNFLRHTLLEPIESEEELLSLSEEIDSVGLPAINVKVDVLEQLINSVRVLVQMHRKSLTQISEISLEQTKLKNENISYQKLVDQYVNKVKVKDYEIKLLHEHLRKKESEFHSMKDIKSALLKEVDCMKSLCSSKSINFEHQINKLLTENIHLKSKVRENIGKYVSKDDSVIDLLNKYKAKEAIYEDTIKKLQQNNQHLLEEVLSLKEEVLLALYTK